MESIKVGDLTRVLKGRFKNQTGNVTFEDGNGAIVNLGDGNLKWYKVKDLSKIAWYFQSETFKRGIDAVKKR